MLHYSRNSQVFCSGWSGERHNHGTYNHTWTWFEVGIEHGTSDEGRVQLPRRDVQRNVHGSFVSRIHVNTWDHMDNLPDLQDWLRSIRPGDSISLYPRAAFPGWENHVQLCRIDVFCSW